MRTFFPIFLLVFLFGCHKNQAVKKLETNFNNQKDLIKEININVVDGMLGIKASYEINEDSIIYKYSNENDPNDTLSIKQKNTKAEWQKLLKEIDINNFKSAKNGKSLQAENGLDTKITLKLKDTFYSITNANDNKSWNGIMEIVRTYKR